MTFFCARYQKGRRRFARKQANKHFTLLNRHTWAGRPAQVWRFRSVKCLFACLRANRRRPFWYRAQKNVIEQKGGLQRSSFCYKCERYEFSSSLFFFLQQQDVRYLQFHFELCSIIHVDSRATLLCFVLFEVRRMSARCASYRITFRRLRIFAQTLQVCSTTLSV